MSTEGNDGGNQEQDDVTSLEQAGNDGTPDTDNRNAESGEDWKKLAISLQEKAARVNALEAKVKELEEVRQPPAVETQEVQDRTDQIDDLEAQVEAFKRQKDPVAAMVLEEKAARLRLERDLILTRQLDRVPPELQDRTLKYFNKHRHRFADINGARAELENPDLRSENQALKDRLAALEKGPDPEVMRAPSPGSREIGARETKQRFQTQAQWDSKMKELDTKIDDGDMEARNEKYRIQMERRKDWAKQK